MRKFTKVEQVLKHFDNEELARRFLAERRWKGGKPICPVCGNKHVYVISGGPGRYKCSFYPCQTEFTVFHGTAFHKASSRPKYILATEFIMRLNPKVTAQEVAQTIGVTRKTAQNIMERLKLLEEPLLPL